MIEDIVSIFDTFLYSRLLDIHTCIPGQIEEYQGHKERKAKVKILIKAKTIKGESIAIEPIDNVPVVFLGSSNCNTLYPLKKGDGVLLLFAENPIGNFLSANAEQESDDFSKFALTDCIAIPGLWSFKNVPTAPENDTDFFLTFQNASLSIIDKTNDIVLKNNNTTITMENTGAITIENSVGKIEMDNTGIVKINNGNLEVLV